MYGDTEYWGVNSKGNQGIIKPITNNDDPEWSNYNFINSHYTVRDKIVIPYLKTVGNFRINQTARYTEDEDNRTFFRLLLTEKDNLFGLNSRFKDQIVELINRTRKRGAEREDFVKAVLESIPNTSVRMLSGAGSSMDYAGYDIFINTENKIFPKNKLTGQVKKFDVLTKGGKNWYVRTDLKRDYKTDLLIFGKKDGQEYHLAIFENDSKLIKIEEGRIVIPFSLRAILVNHNLVTKENVIKTY
jgi:hypothetical protein